MSWLGKKRKTVEYHFLLGQKTEHYADRTWLTNARTVKFSASQMPLPKIGERVIIEAINFDVVWIMHDFDTNIVTIGATTDLL